MIGSADVVRNALNAGLVVPAFNVPYLPMVESVVNAVAETDSFAFIASARLEWFKFEGKGLKPVFDTYKTFERPEYVRLHLDHVPVIDEDDQRIDFLGDIGNAIALGYHSVMVDGSRLDLAGNIDATAQAVALAHASGVPCEAELGAVLGHESGPPPPYEELFASGRGFTKVDEAARFVKESGCDWLSVAIGNIHGAVSEAYRDQKKPAARLDIDHLKKLRDATGVPLVLHGGSGVRREYMLEAARNGIAKVNVGTEIRQAYEVALRETDDVGGAQAACYARTVSLIREYFGLEGTRRQIAG
ncbi:MAG TPA: class II fructose-bisphosphate aldolase [Candidatus Hydrogenedentes bacterium]|nr:class II fructose-bisphosphate aldolase [Candidatus Hydrogenedentota bacterium]HPG66164.1 class II fructose-bisphosphate aldolase [Candidatus Hydrogenedentota bacterium]